MLAIVQSVMGVKKSVLKTTFIVIYLQLFFFPARNGTITTAITRVITISVPIAITATKVLSFFLTFPSLVYA